MKVAVFGGTGFIGKELVKKLKEKNVDVLLCDVRKADGWESKLSIVDAVFNLGGTGLFSKRWNDDVKTAIHSSRVQGTKKIVSAIERLKNDGKKYPQTLINSSAIGYYGPSFDEEITEETPSGSDFLAMVCRDWEDAAFTAQRKLGMRTVLVRTGVVIGKGGGALEKLLTPFKLGLGGPVGMCGKQWFSWIHIDDIVGIMIHALENSAVSGPINGTAPSPLPNIEFAKIFGSVLHRPAFLPLPGIMLYAMVGEAAEILVNGQRVLPKKALDTGYKFKFPELREALENILR